MNKDKNKDRVLRDKTVEDKLFEKEHRECVETRKSEYNREIGVGDCVGIGYDDFPYDYDEDLDDDCDLSEVFFEGVDKVVDKIKGGFKLGINWILGW